MKTNQLKKLGLAIISAVMMFSSALGNLGIVSAKEVKYSIREYETGYKTDRGTNLLKLRIKGADIPDYGTHWGQVAFCVQHGETLPKGSHIFNNGDPTGIYRNAARVAYLATYRYNNGESGGMKRYAYTQNLIWQVLGQVSQGHSMGDDYSSWKSKIMDEYNKWDTMPSFHTSTQKFELGQSKTLKDTNGVLKYYDTFDYTKDGVTFEHTKGSNTMKVTVSSKCSKESVAITTSDAIKGGMSKYTNSSSSQVNFVLKSTEKQDLICSPGYSDPRYFNIKIDINSFGSLEIAKKDNKGNYVPDVSFKVSYNADMSSPIGTYKTGTDGKVKINKLKAGKVYVQETKAPDHLIIDKTIHAVTIKSNDVSSFTATNDWKQGYIQVTKKDAKTGQVVKKAGTEFEIVQGTKVIETISTNENGIAKSGLLDYGTYIVREKKEPANYVIATLVQEQSITQNGKTYDITIFNEPVLGQINLSKEDIETGKTAQGDATLKGAVYTLKANDKITNPADGSVIYKKGEVISIKNIGNSTYGDTGEKQLMISIVSHGRIFLWENMLLRKQKFQKDISSMEHIK
ncbi:MAG: SpaA isopeptide-forming pilin-related protein [Coprobacillus cateniformis]